MLKVGFSHLHRAIAGAVVLALTLMAVAMPPAHNWDMLPYVALSLKAGDSAGRHSELWALVDEHVPAADRALLRGTQAPVYAGIRRADVLAYRHATATDAAAFTQQLPFYAVKPMYPMAIAGVTRASNRLLESGTLNPIAVSIAIAKFFWVVLGAGFFALVSMRLGAVMAAGITLPVMGLPVVHNLASYSTPDTLSGALIMAVFVLALRDPTRTWTVGALGIALLGVAARPDNLMLLGLLLLWFRYNQRIPTTIMVAVGLLGVAWYLLLAKLSGNYGWAVLMHHSFIDYAELPAALLPDLSLPTLAAIYLTKLGSSTLFFACALVCGLCAAARFLRRGMTDQLFQALIIMLAFMLAHWLVFPDQKDRLMVASYLFVGAGGLFVLADVWADTVGPALQSRGLLERRGEANQ